MSDGRTTILARVREAMSIPTDTKFLHFRQHDGAAPADPRSFMPPCGDKPTFTSPWTERKIFPGLMSR